MIGKVLSSVLFLIMLLITGLQTGPDGEEQKSGGQNSFHRYDNQGKDSNKGRADIFEQWYADDKSSDKPSENNPFAQPFW